MHERFGDYVLLQGNLTEAFSVNPLDNPKKHHPATLIADYSQYLSTHIHGHVFPEYRGNNYTNQPGI